MTRLPRLIAIAGALATSAALLTPTASQAQAGPYYAATPEAKPGKASFLTRETVWTWRDNAYVARRGGDRDAVQCELVARRAGKLASFTAGGTAFDAAALERCNAKAR